MKKHISCIKIQKLVPNKKHFGHTTETVVINYKDIFYKNFIKEKKSIKRSNSMMNNLVYSVLAFVLAGSIAALLYAFVKTRWINRQPVENDDLRLF